MAVLVLTPGRSVSCECVHVKKMTSIIRKNDHRCQTMSSDNKAIRSTFSTRSAHARFPHYQELYRKWSLWYEYYLVGALNAFLDLPRAVSGHNFLNHHVEVLVFMTECVLNQLIYVDVLLGGGVYPSKLKTT